VWLLRARVQVLTSPAEKAGKLRQLQLQQQFMAKKQDKMRVVCHWMYIALFQLHFATTQQLQPEL